MDVIKRKTCTKCNGTVNLKPGPKCPYCHGHGYVIARDIICPVCELLCLHEEFDEHQMLESIIEVTCPKCGYKFTETYRQQKEFSQSTDSLFLNIKVSGVESKGEKNG